MSDRGGLPSRQRVGEYRVVARGRPALSGGGWLRRNRIRRPGEVECPWCGDWVPPEWTDRCLHRPAGDKETL